MADQMRQESYCENGKKWRERDIGRRWKQEDVVWSSVWGRGKCQRLDLSDFRLVKLDGGGIIHGD